MKEPEQRLDLPILVDLILVFYQYLDEQLPIVLPCHILGKLVPELEDYLLDGLVFLETGLPNVDHLFNRA